MGYYTRFELEITGTGERWVTGVDAMGQKVQVNIGLDHNEIEREIVELSGYSSLFDGNTHKWYDHAEHMTAISKKYPDLLFTLNGAGEETGDFWRDYYKGGKRQHEEGKIAYGEFDPAKLK
jgi:hypothetical protein